MKRTFKYPVYPTRVQEAWLFAELKHQKRLQNYMLQMRSQMWEYGSISVSMIDQINHLKKLRENNTYYSDHPQDMQVSTIKRVNEAKTHFSVGVKTRKPKRKDTRNSKGLSARCRGLCESTHLRVVNVSVKIRSVKLALGITV